MIFSLLFSASDAQNKKTRELLASIEGKYSIDDRGEVSFEEIINFDSASAELIYSAALLQAKTSFESKGIGEISHADKSLQSIIVTGIWKEVFSSYAITTETLDTKYRVSYIIENGKAKIKVAITGFTFTESGSMGRNDDLAPKEIYPFNPRGRKKNIEGKGFYNSYAYATQTLAQIKKELETSPLLGN